MTMTGNLGDSLSRKWRAKSIKINPGWVLTEKEIRSGKNWHGLSDDVVLKICQTCLLPAREDYFGRRENRRCLAFIRLFRLSSDQSRGSSVGRFLEQFPTHSRNIPKKLEHYSSQVTNI